MRRINRVAVLHNGAHVGSAWSCAEGVVHTLRRLGITADDCGNPRYRDPDFGLLSKADAILLCGPEWFLYPMIERHGAAWQSLKVPKVAWYAESAHRDDRDFDFGIFSLLCDLNYFPARQDAEEYNGIWLPFGVDENIFHPCSEQKVCPVGFVGSLYPKRQEFMRTVGKNISILSQKGGSDPESSFLALARIYSSIGIFVNFPAYSRLLVTKVTEVMACRTMLITPRLDDPSALTNMTQFEHERHLVYYDPSRPAELAALIEHYSKDAAAREAIAETGYREVQVNHRLTQRLQRIMADLASAVSDY